MNTSLLIRNAQTVDEKRIDVFVKDGVIVQIGEVGSLSSTAEVEIDASGMVLLPGLFDVHAHLCQPGGEDKERISTATAAALHGGITGLMAMPDTAPVMDNAAQITTFMEICRTDAQVEVIPTGCLTKGCEGEEQASYDSLRAKGVRFITDGDRAPDNMLLLYRAMQYASNLNLTFALRGDVPALTAKATMHPGTTSYYLGLTGAPACAEEIGMEAIIRLSAETGNALHVQTVSTSGSVDILRRCKSESASLSAEVALHHLIFTHEDVGRYDTNYKTVPPLRDRADVDALIDAVNDGVIDCIVSDHTPCTAFSKLQDFITAPQGMIGLDTYLPAIYHYLVSTGKMSWATVVRACSESPRRLMGLAPIDLADGQPANFVLFNPAAQTEVTPQSLRSRASNTPFLGKTLKGKVELVAFGDKVCLF